jgi:hypothetical protein
VLKNTPLPLPVLREGGEGKGVRRLGQYHGKGEGKWAVRLFHAPSSFDLTAPYGPPICHATPLIEVAICFRQMGGRVLREGGL